MNWLRVYFLVLLISPSVGAQGYRLERDRLIVTPEDWQEWRFPQGSAEFSAEGVRPQFIRPQTNAVQEASNFTREDGTRGGIRNAGTNPAQAVRIIDGREDTFWEPDPEAPLEDWWVEIDLGRVVWARKVVVKFVEEGVGDPFLQFKLLTSNGRAAFSQSSVLNYVVAGRTEGLNKTRRVFEFDLEPTVKADPGFSGDLIQYLQIVATASDRGQAQEISENRWQSLPEEERGDVLYFRREASGRLRKIDQAQYEAIADPALQGPIDYYRRERPGLAEVEVWTGGDNISLGALDRGGEIVAYGSVGAEVFTIDGDYNTYWHTQIGVTLSALGGELSDPERYIFFDLGTWYWLDRTLITFNDIGYSHWPSFPNYVVNLSDGRRAPDGGLVYSPMAARDTGAEVLPYVFFQENVFPLTRTRYFRIDYRVLLTQQWYSSGIREIQLYGYGFLPQVSLESELIELGQDPRILSTIHWEADTPPGTQMQIRTRTGNQIEQEIHYFNTSGVEVTEAKYRKLLSFQRGDSLVTLVPGADWSTWSQYYPASGAAITSPSPRRYAMVQATLQSDDPDQAVRLRQLSIELDTPLASQVLGEIAPQKIGQHGQREIFTLFLRPRFQADSRGFDQVLVALPPGTGMELVEVAAGSESEVVAGQGQVFVLDQLERVESGSDSLWVRLPMRIDQQGAELVALRFAGVLYLASNTFVASVGLGEGEERVWQRVDAGEVTSLEAGRGMTVFTPFEGSLLGEVEAAPNPFTPNGDGVNDAVKLVFPVFKVQGSKPLVLEVYSLDNRLVRRVEQPVVHAAGRQQVAWDGRDQEGRLSPPGLYICRVGLEVDAEGEEPMAVKLVASVY